MKNLRHRFERFCFRHRKIGIPNLMLYLCLGSALVYLFTAFKGSNLLYYWLYFDRDLILQGQVWRLFSYPLTYGMGNPNLILVAISLLCYYSLGRAMENIWGTLRFNLFYFTGLILMDVFCLIFDDYADVTYLNLSLFLGYATLYPNAQFLLLFIIPVKAWIFALFDIALTLYEVIAMSAYGLFPYSLFPLVAIANYFLFFGKDVCNVIPISWRGWFRRLFRKKPRQPKVVPFPGAKSTPAFQETYNHRCTVCGRTDVSDPELEFRYCSKCRGYFCYCEDHINRHEHISE